jgi:outer membrane protein OmpA-like peptidoglycan-associated protein/opacity protein-like surface antigen
MTNLRGFIMAASLAAVPALASAEPMNGWYIHLGAGVNLTNSPTENESNADQFAAVPGLALNVKDSGHINLDTGFGVFGAAGYGFGNGFRGELEVSYRQNHLSKFVNSPNVAIGNTYTSGSDERKYSIMGNVLYDFNNLGLPVTPYIGGGIGVTVVDWSNATRTATALNFGPTLGTTSAITQAFSSSDAVFSAQLIAGMSVDIASIPGLAFTADARVLSLPLGFNQHGKLTLSGPTSTFPLGTISSPSNFKFGQELNYGVMLGLRYAFGAPKAAPAPAPVATPAPAVQPARSYLVFFDWDKATLTDRARQIIKEAADNSTRVQYTQIAVNGYADTSGTPQYNQGLSMRRAQAVAAELVKDGVPKGSIAIKAFGDTVLLVQTGAGVREPQNRRVEIIIK